MSSKRYIEVLETDSIRMKMTFAPGTGRITLKTIRNTPEDLKPALVRLATKVKETASDTILETIRGDVVVADNACHCRLRSKNRKYHQAFYVLLDGFKEGEEEGSDGMERRRLRLESTEIDEYMVDDPEIKYAGNVRGYNDGKGNMTFEINIKSKEEVGGRDS